MSLAMMWIAPVILTTLSLSFVRITTYAIKLSPTDVAWKAGMDAPELQKEPVTDIFRELKFSRLLCAILPIRISKSLGCMHSFHPLSDGLGDAKICEKKNVMFSAFSILSPEPSQSMLGSYSGSL